MHDRLSFFLTLDRGVYVDHADRWPEHFRGIGIRIEDSVCVGSDAPVVLTGEAVKDVCLCALLQICELI